MRLYKIFFLIAIFHLQDSYAQYCIDGRFDKIIFDSLDIEILPNIIYGEAVNDSGVLEQLRLDLYRPSPGVDPLPKKPVIVYVHGGSLRAGDKSSASSFEIGHGLAERGFIYVSINYRLGWNDIGNCKGDTASLQYALYRGIQDTKASVRFLKENADLYGIDTNYIFLGGSSVGCTIIINAAYANQENYPSYLYDSLGSVDSSSNTLFDHTFEIKGIFNKAAGIQFPNILDNRSVPILFFHGTCDPTVPYKDGPLFFCYKPVEYMHYYGSWYLARLMEEKHIPYELYTNEAYEHDSAENDTVTEYTGNYFKEILCGDVPASREFYRYNPGGCLVSSQATISFDYYPNPFDDEIFVSVNAAVEQDITIELFNSLGQAVFRDTKHYIPPITQYEVQLHNYGLTSGIYFIRFSAGNIVHAEMIYKQN